MVTSREDGPVVVTDREAFGTNEGGSALGGDAKTSPPVICPTSKDGELEFLY